ncbi:MAG: phosphoribosylanthranilate isomerase [Alphaproteobacteria bacterium]|nr:phosphoribosylanthranilate isomerase [Alphaproteobacteria bacterium]
MAVAAKICGVNDPAAMCAAVDAGARHVGLVFYPPSPRYVTQSEAAALAALVPEGITRVGLFVDPTDAEIDAALAATSLDLLQLHGSEDPARVAALKARTGIAVMKAISVADETDIGRADAYLDVADWLMFDAKPPKDMAGALPGGNALSFEWRLLGGLSSALPWMLAGGLTAENVAQAVSLSGASVVDTSSGVEDAPGRKNPDKIRAFLNAVNAL